MQERNVHLDLLRFLSIVGVITLHCSAGLLLNNQFFLTQPWFVSLFYDSLFRWCVPTFIMISGVLLIEKCGNAFDFKRFYTDRFLKILIPFLAWSLIYVYWKNKDNVTVDYWTEIKSIATQPIYYHLWFVYMILGIYCIMPVIAVVVKNSRSEQVIIYFLILWFILGPTKLTIENLYGPILRLDVEYLNGALPYTIMGYYLNRLAISKKIFLYSVVLFLSSLSVTMFSVIHAIKTNGQINFFFLDFRAPNVVIMSATIFLITKFICNLFNFDNFSILSQILSFISKLSLGVYLCHVIILESLTLGYFGFKLDSYTFNAFASVPLFTLSTLLMSLLFCLFIYKISPPLRKILI